MRISICMEVPKMVGLCHGKSQSKMDDKSGYPYVRKPPYDLNKKKMWPKKWVSRVRRVLIEPEMSPKTWFFSWGKNVRWGVILPSGRWWWKTHHLMLAFLSKKDRTVKSNPKIVVKKKTMFSIWLQGGAPPIISWFIIPITMDMTP